jgi:hypothetical protein
MEKRSNSLPRRSTEPRHCDGCGKVFPPDEYRVGRRKVIYRVRCRPCHSEIQKIKDLNPRSRYSFLKVSSRKRGLVCTISFEEYAAIVKNPCFFCGGALPLYGAAMDRIDNSKGYEPGNVIPACGFCNYVKGEALDQTEMMMLVPGIQAIQKRRKELGMPPLLSHLQISLRRRGKKKEGA